MAGDTKDEGTVKSWRVEGRVQGVGFRWFVRTRARGLGLVGWVRNEPDGSVRVLARGSEEGVSELEEALGVGPKAADVRGIETIPGGPSEGLGEFEIRRQQEER